MVTINELVKVTVLDCLGKFLFCPTWVNWKFWGPKLTFLKFSLNLLLGISGIVADDRH